MQFKHIRCSRINLKGYSVYQCKKQVVELNVQQDLLVHSSLCIQLFIKIVCILKRFRLHPKLFYSGYPWEMGVGGW